MVSAPGSARSSTLRPLADVVAVHLDREGSGRTVLVLGDRGDGGGGDVVEMHDLAVARDGAALAEEAGDQGRHVALRGALQHRHRERAVVDLDPLADPDRAVGEVGERVGVLGQRGHPLDRLAGVGLDPHPHGVVEVAAVEGGESRPAVVVGAGPRLQPRVGVDPLHHGGVDPDPAGEDEMAPVDGAEVDPARRPFVGQRQQVLGRVDDVVGDAEGAADDVGRAARQHRDRHVGPGEPVDHLVQRPVAAEGDDDVVAVVAHLAADLGGVVLRLGRHRLDLVAPLQRVDDEVAQPVGDRRRVGVDDDQHPPLGGAGLYPVVSYRIAVPSSASRTLPSLTSRSAWPITSERVRKAWVTATLPQIACASS